MQSEESKGGEETKLWVLDSPNNQIKLNQTKLNKIKSKQIEEPKQTEPNKPRDRQNEQPIN